MFYRAGFFVLLGFSACKNSQKSQDSQNNTTQQDSPKTYTAMDLNNQEYTIMGDLDSLNISPDSNTPTLLVLSALDNSLKDYAPSFNILKKPLKIVWGCLFYSINPIQAMKSKTLARVLKRILWF